MEGTGVSEMRTFQDDDRGYVDWLATHPQGFVINCYPNPSADYLMLHRAACTTISELGPNMEHWTHDYIKVCGETRGAALRWCRDYVGSEPSACQVCYPLSPQRWDV
jgi:hypothetical protein